MQEYLESIGKSEVDETVESLYKKAKSQLIKLQEFEDSLDRNGGNMPDYQKYIDYERKTGNPARVISIYERSAVENCLNFQLWIDYGHYLDREVKIGDLAVKVYSRAVRNCPWVTQLWTQYLMVMEKYPRENHWKAISSAFEQSLNGGFSSAAEGIELWLSYAYAIRRKISAETDKNSAVVNGTSNYSEMKEVLGRGAKSLKELFLDEWDSTGHYRKSWAYLEGYYGGNLEKMRELWQEILHEGNARFASVWLEYFNAERLFGDVESRRKVLLKAVHSASDYPESICHQLIQFEREEGSVETLESAVLRVEQQLGRVNERRAKQNERESQEKQQKKKPAPLRQQHPVEPKKKTQMIFETSDEAKPQNRREIGTKRPAEEIKPQPKPSSKPTEVDTEGFAIPSGPPVSKKPKVADTQNIPNPKSTKPAVSTGAQQHDTSRYPRTVFISNLDFHLSDPESRLRDIFTPIGSISEIRLVKHISGRFKGYAYVEFSNEEVVPEALKLDHHRIDGRPMYVSRCQERNDRGKNSSEPPPGFKFGLGLEKKKLFVRNIPIEITEEQLREIFQPYGSLKEVRLATFKNGKSKGWAFVEFDDESSASKALVKTDGTVVGGKEISVAISNPPARKERLATAPMIAPTPEQLAMKFTPALGGQGSKSGTFGAGETSMEGRKERLDVFKPRIITSKTVVKEESSVSSQMKFHRASDVYRILFQKSSPVKTELAKLENNTEPTAMAQSSKMSNEQFRNLFMKK